MKPHFTYYSPTRLGAILQSHCLSILYTFCNRFLSYYWRECLNIWCIDLHEDLYHVSSFQVPHSSTSCLPIDLLLYLVVHNGNFGYRFLSIHWREFLFFVLLLLHYDLYLVSSFQVGVFFAQSSVQQFVFYS